MPRFGRPRANTGDSSNQSDFQYTTTDSERSDPVNGFAASAAAGGVASGMTVAAAAGVVVGDKSNRSNTTTPSGQSVISGVSGGTSPSRGMSSGGRGTRKQKGSITSGISTLFRRQPSPDLDESNFVGGTFVGGGGGTSAFHRDPTGVHATRPASATNTSVGDNSSAWTSVGDTTATSPSAGRSPSMMSGIPKNKKKSPRASPLGSPSRGRNGLSPGRQGKPTSRSPSTSRSNTPNKQQYTPSQQQQFKQNVAEKLQQQQQQQQYSQTQRDLLHRGAYDQPQYVQQHAQPTRSQHTPQPQQQKQKRFNPSFPNANSQDDPQTPGISNLSHAIHPGISDSMSGGGASDTLSGATSISRECSDHNHRSNSNTKRTNRNTRRAPLAQPSVSYDDTLNTYDTQDQTHASDGETMSDGDYDYSDDGESYDSSTVESRQRGNSGRGKRERERDRKPKKRNKKERMRLPRRYRGFSTSISSLFLDESIVCGALSCCGLLLSARTEHLLNERNVKRGLTRRGVGGAAGRGKEGGRRAPSRILGIAWVLTILGVLTTYAIWGFYDDEDWYDEGGNNNQNNDDGNQDQVANDDANDDGGQNQGNDDGGNAANDDANQVDDGNANYYAYDDAAQADDGGNNVDDAVQADDGAINADDADYYAYDDAAQADDGAAAANDDAVQADDGNANDDAVQADDAAQYYADDAAADDYNGNRKLTNGRNALLGGFRSEPSLEWSLSTTGPRKHPLNGIMKMRDHKEYIVEPAVGMASQCYTNLMAQFKDDEYTPFPNTQLHQRHLEEVETIEATSDYEQGQQARTILIVLFLFLLGVIGRRRRMRTRFAILRSRAQDDHLYYASLLTKTNGAGASGSLATPDNTVMENFHEREDKYDGACSHTLFGCYPVDSQLAHYADYGDDNDDDATDDQTISTAGTSAKKKRKGGDFMSRTMDTMFNCCCGRMCQCWCQLFSVCSLAQEAREAKLLLPPSMQRIDIITHQPFHEYAKDVNNVRRRFFEHANRTWMQHYAALSHLSRYILVGFVLITAFVVMTMLFHPTGGFTWGDALVLIATFTQSFLVLVIVFGIFHRSDLSFDAVVKFFAVGFVICVPVGFVIEGIVMNGLFMLFYWAYYMLHWIGGDNFDDWYQEYYRIIFMLGELVNAYFVAALVEELCKYYGFRFVEHPDLIFLTGLDRSAEQTQSSGGLDSYKYDSQLVSAHTEDSEEERDTDSRGRKRKNKRRGMLDRSRDEEEEEPDLRTLQQQAAAITTGMISVAVGLACAENFLYVFFLGGTGGDESTGNNIPQELAILLFRSIFPVHALSAAMQSVNMIRKFIEERHGGERNIGVGRIIIPAILLHGTFDAILMCVNAYIESAWRRYYENGGSDDDDSYEVPYNALAVNLIAPLGIIGVMAVSFGWHSYQNKLQMLRLARFEMKNKSRSGRSDFNAPNLV